MSSREPRAVILGIAGPQISGPERAFLREQNPLGFILFARNCVSAGQVRRLIIGLRETVGRGDAPVLIDQEGGRVQRLRPPGWPDYPAAAQIGALGGSRAIEAARLGARLIADDLAQLGITLDCMPVLDVPTPGADPVIGDRAYSAVPGRVATVGGAVCEGLLAGGVLPVLKHIPGHGRATVDSHTALPTVDASRNQLESTDLVPFRALAAMPWAMTAHIVYAAIDPAAPATLSPRVIAEIVRGNVGYEGFLVTDDLGMGALPGSLGERAARALAAGCDAVLHCTGIMEEMAAVAAAAGPLSAAAQRRLAVGEERRTRGRKPFDRDAAQARFAALMKESG